MTSLLTPKLDLVFKLLFTRDIEILLDLVNTVLKSSQRHQMCSLEVKNPTILPEELTEKLIILDIQAADEAGRRYDIEMQVRKYVSYAQRALHYLCRLYAGQLGSGEQYGALKSVIGIHFLDYTIFSEQPELHFCFEMRDAHHPTLRLTDDLSLHIFELPKLNDHEKDGQRTLLGEKMYEWLHFFNHAHEEDEESMKTHYSNPAIHKAFHVLQQLSAEEETRLRAELRERALRNALSELAAAREEGREEGELLGNIRMIRMLQRVLKHQISPEEELSQKSPEELEQLIQELEAEID